MKTRTTLLFTGAMLLSPIAFAAAQWDEGMDDDAGKAKATTKTDLPAADYEGARKIYPKRDRLFTTSLDGTWRFKLVPGLDTPDALKGWIEPGYDTRDWDPIDVPGNWETQGFKSPQYGNQIDEMSGFYVRDFNWNYRWEGQRVILRFDGVLFGYEAWVNGKYVGRWGSAYNLAQWDVTDKLVKGRNTIAVKVLTRSHAWLFDTNDCWAIAGIFRSVELFTVPNDYIEDITFRTLEVDQAAKSAKVSVQVDTGYFDKKTAAAKRAYVSLVDEDGLHALDFDMPLKDGKASAEGTVAGAHLWSAEDPYLYDLVVTLVDAAGGKMERISEKQGLKTVKVDGTKLFVNGSQVFLNGVAWNEIDPVEGRAISKENRRAQMQLMKKAGVNAIRTAHYPFGPDFLDLADEMGFYVIDEVPFGSRGSMLLKNKAFKDELITRTEATMRRDKNHAAVIFWTFGNENTFTPNTVEVLAYAKAKDPTRPRGLPQIGSSQAKETMYHPERDVDLVCAHYLSRPNMEEYEKNTTKPIVQTEFAHACGNGFDEFEDRLRRMKRRTDVWAGGCIWAWIDQSVMHDEHNAAFEKELSLTRTQNQPDGTHNSDIPKDLRRDLPREFQGNYVDPLHFIDSWGDRATDGIVYGDGTPKDGYWLVKALYAGKKGTPRPATEAPAIDKDNSIKNLEAVDEEFFKEFRLRVGRKIGLDQAIQRMGKPKKYLHKDYLIEPRCQKFVKDDKCATCSLRWVIDGNEDTYIEGTVTASISEDGKGVIAYELAPSDLCAATDEFAELGLTIAIPDDDFNRVDWVGDGPLTGVPGKMLMNTFGTWAMHKDDYRFPGNRMNVKWAAVGANGSTECVVFESGTGNVSFENLNGRILITENVAVAGYGGKSSGPSGLKQMKDVNMKGSFRFYLGRLASPRADVVPDLTYTFHYGF